MEGTVHLLLVLVTLQLHCLLKHCQSNIMCLYVVSILWHYLV